MGLRPSPPAIPDLAASPVVVQAGAETVMAAGPVEVVIANGADALRALDRLEPGWWAGFLSYDLGRAVERVRPRSDAVADHEAALPDLVLARYDARLVLPGVTGSGTTRARLVGSRAATGRLERLLDAAVRPGPSEPLGRARTSLEREDFEAGVRSIIELIEAGDCYQVNLTRRLRWDRSADPRSLYRALVVANPAPHAAMLALDSSAGHGPGVGRIAVVSASPEQYLSWHDRRVVTRPIKGTARDAAWLQSSAKDRAENVMIVDLARNDLGRVCTPGSVITPELCALEAHPGLHHLVSTVQGQLRDDVGVGRLIGATFPPASVTGAPKPRVLQAIEDLEPVRRGVYCGAVGWIDTEHDAGSLAVAIRTFTIADSHTSLGVGAGIVADSRPSAEWGETELKAQRLLRAVGATEDPTTRTGSVPGTRSPALR